MALNKYMHPRNIYKTPPDFEKLSKMYQDFSKIVKTDITGKITVDFKDPHSLRILTKCLLKSDFNLDVDIPEDRLVPTLPLRLNYVLWIEDLMAAIQRKSEIKGIDIGTGACVIYPLLAARKNRWHMLATETDLVSLAKAEENIHQNKLEQLIQLKNNNNKETKLIDNLFNEDTPKYDFCMCNPPFYSNLQELYESRSPARLPPKNGFTGSPQELITEGGELKFCRQLIEESKICKNNVLIFTTMVGHKYNLSELLQDLKADGIKHTHTEFCQGRVTRWGLAWTFQNYDLYQLVPPREKPRKKNVPIIYQLPPLPYCEYNFDAAYMKLKIILTDLQIEHKVLNKCGNHISLDIIAKENTWSNQRRKRRLMKKIEATEAKKLKSEEAEVTKVCDGAIINENKNYETNNVPTDIDHTMQANTENNGNIQDPTNNSMKESSTVTSDCDYNITVSQTAPISTSTMTTVHENQNYPEEPLVHAFMKLFKKDNSVQLEIELINGTGGKESVHQILQYIKNNWK